MIQGDRELIIGLIHDEQFGPTIMLGVGGIYAEALGDVVFRPLPLRPNDLEGMLGALNLKQVFSEFRGQSSVILSDLQAVLTAIEAVGNIISGRSDKDNVWNVNVEKEYHEAK